MATIQEQIREVFDKFINGGETISNRGALEEMLAEAFGGPDTFLYEGWKCNRILNENIPKFRGRQDLDYYGYQCMHVETGRIFYIPGSNQDARASYIRSRIDFWNEWFTKFGNLDDIREQHQT